MIDFNFFLIFNISRMFFYLRENNCLLLHEFLQFSKIGSESVRTFAVNETSLASTHRIAELVLEIREKNLAFYKNIIRAFYKTHLYCLS